MLKSGSSCGAGTPYAAGLEALPASNQVVKSAVPNASAAGERGGA
jgi:hypothetical protein